MSTSAIGTVLDALRTSLVARTNLSGVNVFSGPVSAEEAGLECIAFGDADLTEVAFAMGGLRQETWTVEGETRVVAAWKGTTELTIAAARDRALAIFAELESHLNDTFTGGLPNAELTSARIAQNMNPEGRVCSLVFTLTITAVKNP